MGGAARGRPVGAIIGATTFVCLWMAAAGSAHADSMTGPIDLGAVKTETIQLNPGQSIQPAPPSHIRSRSQTKRAGSAARALDIKAFYGKFVGNGLSEGVDVAYFGVTERDLDVRISPAGDGGFTVAWTTVIHQGNAPNSPNIRRRATTMTFEPGPQPGIFQATDNGDPLAGGLLSWASISGNTLTVHQFTVHADGRHEIQTYARTLSGTGMKLVYTRAVDGERMRRVRGQLVKNAN